MRRKRPSETGRLALGTRRRIWLLANRAIQIEISVGKSNRVHLSMAGVPGLIRLALSTFVIMDKLQVGLCGTHIPNGRSYLPLLQYGYW
jgi:hypothetical protein